MNSTAKKLISYLEGKSEYHMLIQNEIDEMTSAFVVGLEEKIELFTRKCLPILEGETPVPALIRKKSNDLLEEALTDEGRSLVTATNYMDEIRYTVGRDLLRVDDDLPWVNDDSDEDDDEDDDHRGLDSDRDTEEQLENVLRIFPDVLLRYPGVFRCDSLQDVVFVPLILSLRTELCFGMDEDARGGLLESNSSMEATTLDCLVTSALGIGDKQLVDDRFVTVLRGLREMGYLCKGDIRRHRLLRNLLYTNISYFPEKRFRFFARWDPDALTRTDSDDYLPIHYASNYSTLRGFQLVLEAGIRYFPGRKGINLLFRKDSFDDTPYRCACEKHGQEVVSKAIESTLIDCADEPYDAAGALVLAAIDDNVDLDCVYYVLRREPDVLAKLLSASGGNRSGGGA